MLAKVGRDYNDERPGFNVWACDDGNCRSRGSTALFHRQHKVRPRQIAGKRYNSSLELFAVS